VVDAFDEGASGLPSAGGFAIRATFQTSIAALNAAIFVVPLLVALVIEGPILLACERFARHRVLGFGLLGMALGALMCGVGPNVYTFSAGFSVFCVASGVACGIAQAALMDADPEHREQRMTEWAVSGWLGDFAAPALLWSSAAAGLGWRGAFVAMSFALVLAALAFLRRPLPSGTSDQEEDDDELPLGDTLRLLARSRSLFWWLLGVALCSLLDEIVTALAGMRIEAAGGDAAGGAAALFAFTAGGVLGLFVLGRLLKGAVSLWLLQISCVGCALSVAMWIACDSVELAVPLLFLVGVFSSAHYPIAQAQAYASLPGRSTLVAAAGQPFLVFEVLMPLGLGALADGFGLTVALSATLLQPLGLLLIAAAGRRSKRRQRMG
jgi:MFS transporter, FSR family, fosmidomycin resistance protein